MTVINRRIRILKSIIYLSIAVIFTGQILFWFLPDYSDAISASNPIIDAHGGLDALTPIQSVLGFLVMLAPKLVLVWAFVLLLRLCNSFATDDWFNNRTEAYCEKIGRWMIAYAVLAVVHRSLLSLVVTMNNPPGERELTISISTNDLMALLPALLALIIGHMVGIAKRQREELNEII